MSLACIVAGNVGVHWVTSATNSSQGIWLHAGSREKKVQKSVLMLWQHTSRKQWYLNRINLDDTHVIAQNKTSQRGKIVDALIPHIISWHRVVSIYTKCNYILI